MSTFAEGSADSSKALHVRIPAAAVGSPPASIVIRPRSQAVASGSESNPRSFGPIICHASVDEAPVEETCAVTRRVPAAKRNRPVPQDGSRMTGKREALSCCHGSSVWVSMNSTSEVGV